MIRKHLDLEPRAVPKHLWKALRQHDSVNIRTFSEHREHLFLEREEVPIEDNPFSSHMRYLLRACLLAHHSTSDKRFVIVDGGQLGLNSYYDKTEKTWKLDKKLFNVLDLRTWVYCDASKVQLHESSDNYIFLWDRPVIEVYGRMIDDLTYADLNLATNDADETDKASGKSEGDLRKEADERRRWLEGMVSELLPSVPRGLKITPTSKGRELEVSWQSAESMAVCKISAGMQRVTLHRHVSCHAKASDSLFDAGEFFYPLTFDPKLTCSRPRM
jgi:hypothetical protein